jgi:hypothetical protein
MVIEADGLVYDQSYTNPLDCSYASDALFRILFVWIKGLGMIPGSRSEQAG